MSEGLPGGGGGQGTGSMQVGTKGLKGENDYHRERQSQQAVGAQVYKDLYKQDVGLVLPQLLFHPAIMCTCVSDHIVCDLFVRKIECCSYLRESE